MKRRKVWIWIASTPLAIAVAFVAWIKAVESRRWAAFEARLPALYAEAKGRDPRRPPLRGEALTGNAWTDYEAAIGLLGESSGQVLRDFVQRDRKADPAKAEAIVRANGKALELLKAGARRAEVAFAWEIETGNYPERMGSARILVDLAVGKARFLLQEGRREEARDVLLDAAQIAADIGRNTVRLGEAISMFELGIVFGELMSLPADPEVARALAVLDGSWPDPVKTWVNEAAFGAATLANLGLPGKNLPRDCGRPGWRFGFSQRIMIVDAADTYMGFLSPVIGESRWPHGGARPVEGPFGEREACLRNPVLGIVFPTLSGPVDLERRAQLRLLRVAMGETAPLDDPFGGKIRSDGGKVWSVGRDGMDDAGTGAWVPPRKGDIVLELRRKPGK
jgi:hypothetical protein